MPVLTIEYVLLRGKEEPIVIDKTALGLTLAAAESIAKATLADLRQNRPETGPHGYQIRDEHDKIILRSWGERR